jgi:hypothetical protein
MFESSGRAGGTPAVFIVRQSRPDYRILMLYATLARPVL